MSSLKGYFIQYKFILPKEIKHSSYTYQKLFRAIYGYTQNVSKGGGKVYKYYRKGVLSEVPFLRPGKNSVIIPTSAFNPLITFLKTGKNPTHYWKTKGDWKAVYYMDEKQVSESDVVSALEALLSRLRLSGDSGDLKLVDQVDYLLENSGKQGTKALIEATLKGAEPLVSSEWFASYYKQSDILSSFFEKYKKLKQLL